METFADALNAVTYFVLEVLPSCKNEKDWSLESVKKGLGWARYCEKIASLPNSQFSIARILKNLPSSCDVTHNTLENARLFFLKFLILNQLIPKEVSTRLFEIACNEFGKEKAENFFEECSSTQKLYEETTLIIKDNIQCRNFKFQFHFRLFLEAICNSSNQSFNKILCLEESLEKLLGIIDTLSANDKDKALLSLGDWMSKQMQRESNNFALLQQIAALTLAKLEFLCHIYPGFHKVLLYSAKQSYISSQNDNANMVKNESICRTFVFKLMKIPHLRDETRNILIGWSTLPDAKFWNEILLTSP